MAIMDSLRQSQIVSENLFVNEKQNHQFTGILYKTYSMLNLLELERLDEASDKHEDLYISLDAILSTYEGHTIFSIFISKADVY